MPYGGDGQYIFMKLSIFNDMRSVQYRISHISRGYRPTFTTAVALKPFVPISKLEKKKIHPLAIFLIRF